MKIAARTIVVLVGILLVIGAYGFIFNLDSMLENFGVNATRLDGRGTLRADLGGPFLGIAWFTFVGAITGKTKWLIVPVVFIAAILFGRIVHLVADGVTQKAIVSLIIEAVVLFSLEGSRRLLSRV